MRTTIVVYLMLMMVLFLLGVLSETVLHVALRNAVVARHSEVAADWWPLLDR